MLRPFMVSNDRLFGRGICIEQMAIRSLRDRRHAAQLSLRASREDCRPAGGDFVRVATDPEELPNSWHDAVHAGKFMTALSECVPTMQL
jgi:hypothetical protein